MKSIIRCILSLFILFSIIDFSTINLLKNIDLCPTSIVMSDVIKVQYDLLQQTKLVLKNVFSSIAKDVQDILLAEKCTMMFFDVDNVSLKLQIDNCFNVVRSILSSSFFKNSYILQDRTILLFFFGFIFMFILKYLGLLFTFGKITFLQQYKMAYNID